MISAVVISHGHAEELEHSLPALAPQVDELLVIANAPGSLGRLPDGARVLENEAPTSFAANANKGFANTSGDYVVIANPDSVAEPDAVAALHRFLEAHPHAGVAGPRMMYPDGSWQASRRIFSRPAASRSRPRSWAWCATVRKP